MLNEISLVVHTEKKTLQLSSWSFTHRHAITHLQNHMGLGIPIIHSSLNGITKK